ncbi:up-regulator of cell proliferation-like [Cyprinus carpio]|uniref:Up-regulator of cell proliferation-like n=1 Tax=Cyprinus carpio TaxID=7962 RepID=A0A9Q9XY55_CYPCA|nr:up-regulator of cell proliferation-like [Cyprinus carpio]
MSEHDDTLCDETSAESDGNMEQVPSLEKKILKKLLQNLSLTKYYDKKITLSDVLQIGKDSITDEDAQTVSDLPWVILKRIMMLKTTARSVKCSSQHRADADDSDWEEDDDQESYESDGAQVNPLDIFTALFLCSDSFLQQEMILKMSMCQFAVPLLLPNSDKNQITLMVWAIRGIVQQYRPQSLTDASGFVEERIALSDLPLVSFVRLGRCNISKSHILNKLLSKSQQSTDIFIHHNVDCGDVPKTIANGLVEISWYFPCGNKNIDVFPEPVAIANLRGDIQNFEKQYSFLCKTSTAVFVFFENKLPDPRYISVPSEDLKHQLFWVGDSSNKYIRNTAEKLNLKRHNFLFKTKQNDADFVNKFRIKMQDAIQKNIHRVSIVRMAETARELGIIVDEDAEECQKAKARADEITSKITDTQQFKKKEMPLQGEISKMLAKLEKEECRMKKVGDQSIETYKDHIQTEKLKLRKQQHKKDMSAKMNTFIQAISCPRVERAYFLKWMRMNLENLSRKVIPNLRKQYKEKCSVNVVLEHKQDIADLDRKISNSSLGTEHFIREMGQLYEAAVFHSKHEKSQNQLEHLPQLCAELLLDGFPLELIDGDASSIPVEWLTSVFSELNTLVKPNNKIVVVTVLGVQSSGKSTMLNTMFGVQFAVSNGRCTRGAIIQLIKVKDDFKPELNCDYLLIVDTEGLKSLELATLDNSQEHDNELATLVVGLSDVTIINITMENSTEMKDILQIVVHAFIRMKEIGKKRKCFFVHQNVGNVSAHDSNIRDRQFLLKQLNEMTQAAAKMENKLELQKFTDVMEYDTENGDHYIPGLWHGNPPMAQVSSGYSESVYALKRHIIQTLKCHKSGSICEFLEWTKILWNAVKFEKFIFSFRNSMVADAYIKLCTEYNRWDWVLRKEMHTLTLEAETKILNHGKFEIPDQCTIEDVHCVLLKRAESDLSKGEKGVIDKITTYYEQGENHVELVERYRQDFINSAKCLRTELSNSIKRKLDAALSRRYATVRVERIKKTCMDTMEKKVLGLLEDCRKNNSDMSDETLDKAFESMWTQTVETLSCTRLQQEDIMGKVLHNLRKNLEPRGSSMAENLDKVKDLNAFSHDKFVVPKIKRVSELPPDRSKRLQEMSDRIIDDCKKYVDDKRASKVDYDDTYIREILNNIDENLKAHENHRITEDLELSLKLHICGFTGKEFQDIHSQFIQDNDPLISLERFKQTYHSGFIDLLHERDQCRKKADEFLNNCLKPAVQTYMSEILSTEIAEEMLTGENALVFGTRTAFQYSILKYLLDDFEFKIYAHFNDHYEYFVKVSISKIITEHFSTENRMSKLEERLLSVVTREIIQAITDSEQSTETNDIKKFTQSFCKKLEHRLVFPRDAVDAFMSLSNVNEKQFAKMLKGSVEEMDWSLKESYKATDIQSKLGNLRPKPEDELFKRVCGCGKQCPFCNAPCEAGGEAHTKHFVSVHRPKGLGGYKHNHSICSSSVYSELYFSCTETKGQRHPYKKYKEIYPDWEIQPDPSIEGTAYWKYVMANFNEQFAKVYSAEPGDIPSSWKTITKNQAEKSLKCTN